MALFLAMVGRVDADGRSFAARSAVRSLERYLPLPLRSLSLVTVGPPAPVRDRAPFAQPPPPRRRRRPPLLLPRPMEDRSRISAPHSKLHLCSPLLSPPFWMRCVSDFCTGSSRPLLPSFLPSFLLPPRPRPSLVRDVEVHLERKNGSANRMQRMGWETDSSSCMNSIFCREGSFGKT